MEDKSDTGSNPTVGGNSFSDEQTEKKDLSDTHNADDGDPNDSETDDSMKGASDPATDVSSSNLFEDNREHPIKIESTDVHAQASATSEGSETSRIECVVNVSEKENLDKEKNKEDSNLDKEEDKEDSNLTKDKDKEDSNLDKEEDKEDSNLDKEEDKEDSNLDKEEDKEDPKDKTQKENLSDVENKENAEIPVIIPNSRVPDAPTNDETVETQIQSTIVVDESSTIEESNITTAADKNDSNTSPDTKPPNKGDFSTWTKKAQGTDIPSTNCPFSDIPLHDKEEMKSAAVLPDESSASSNFTSVTNTSERSRDGTSAESPPAGSIQTIFKERITSLASLMQESRSDETGDIVNASGATPDTGVGSPQGDVILVTGGSGFLGQHVVKMLQLRAPHVGEIRVLDLEPFKQKLEYNATKPVKVFVGSITDSECVASAVRGANSVIHVAGLVSWGTFPDVEGMKKVNVQGTLSVVNACLQENISRLIYCSTVDVAVGFEPIRGGDEDTTPIPSEFLFPAYPDTKYQGERLVLGASAYNKEDGGRLQTLALRVNVMYGELDPHYVINGLRDANKRKGVLYQIGDGTAMFQQCYVGNAAWAFVCADVAMKNNPQLTSLPFYVPDNTPVQNTFNFMRPYLEARGFQVSNGHLPYSLVYNGLRVSEVVARLLSRITKLSIPAQSCTVAYINMDIFFKGEKAKEMLKYEPIYSPNEARLASIPYYKEVPL